MNVGVNFSQIEKCFLRIFCSLAFFLLKVCVKDELK